MSEAAELLREVSEADVVALLALLQIRKRLGTRPGTAVVEMRNGEMVVYAVAMAPEAVKSAEMGKVQAGGRLNF